jgi:putative transcriptional regulator
MVKNRLLEIRLHMGYRFQKDFAEFLGVDSNNYNLIENNRKQVSLETALKIAKKLNISVENIFTID